MSTYVQYTKMAVKNLRSRMSKTILKSRQTPELDHFFAIYCQKPVLIKTLLSLTSIMHRRPDMWSLASYGSVLSANHGFMDTFFLSLLSEQKQWKLAVWISLTLKFKLTNGKVEQYSSNRPGALGKKKTKSTVVYRVYRTRFSILSSTIHHSSWISTVLA